MDESLDAQKNSANQRRSSGGWTQGARFAAPVVTAYLPLAFAYGISAREGGLSLSETMLMSLTVYAGAAQMIAVGLYAAGESGWMIVLTTLIVNSRMFLLATAIAPYLHKWEKKERLVFGSLLTDETFALLTTQFRERPAVPDFCLGANSAAHSAWGLGSFLGYVLSGYVVDIKAFGLDYALVSMLLALLALQMRGAKMLAVAVFSGALSTCGFLIGWGSQAVLVGTLAGPFLGVLLERQWRPRNS